MTSEICKYYAKGTCHQGKSCTFRHQKPSKSTTQSGPCKFFLQEGKCAFGQKCSRSHDMKGRPNGATPGPTVSDGDGVKAASKSNASASKSNAPSGKGKGKKQRADPPSSSNPSSNHDKPSGSESQEVKPSEETPAVAEIERKSFTICVFFMQGLCQSGDSCPFLHSEPGVEEDTGAVDEPTKPNPKLLQREAEKKWIVCKHFLRGQCRSGDACKYEHGALGQTSPIIDKEITAGDQFSPSLVTPSGPVGYVTPEIDSGFEDMTMPDSVSSPEIQRLPSTRSPKAEESRTPVGYDSRMDVGYDDSDRQQQEQHEEVLELDCYPVIRGKGKEKEDDTGINLSNPKERWDSDQEFDDESSPMIEDPAEQAIDQDYPSEDQVAYIEEGQTDHADEGQSNDGGEDQSDEERSDSIDEDPQDKSPMPTHKRNGSYYGNGWEDRELGSPLPPSTHPRINHHVTTTKELFQSTAEHYPHISDVKLHWSHFADPLADPAIPFCKLRAQGNCMQGDSCRFRHSLTPQEYTLLFHDQQPNLWTLTRSTSSHAVKARTQAPSLTAWAQLPDHVSDTRPQIESVTPSTAKECMFFRLGKCRNGDICPFRHISPPEGHNSSSENDSSRPKQTCIFFANKGLCDKGDSCRFQHVQEPENPAENSSKEDDNDNGWGSWGKANADDDAKNGDENGQSNGQDPWGPAADISGWGDPNEKTSDTNRTPADPWSTDNHSSRSRTPARPCSFYLSGHCKKGNSCQYLHERLSTSTSSRRLENSTGPDSHKATLQNNEEQDTWGTAWPVQESSSRQKINEPCQYLAQGHCKFGDQCDYLHTDPMGSGDASAPTDTLPEWQSTTLEADPEADPEVSDSESAEADDEKLPDSPKSDLEQEPITFEHPVVKTPIMTCEVTVGPDAAPENIVSASDCNKIVLCGLPADVSPSDVTALCGTHGLVKQVVSLDSTPTSSDVRVEFAETTQAITAARNLNGYIFMGAPLLASLKARIPLTIRNTDAPMLTLKVTWLNASVSAWTHYPTISKAKLEASRLNDTSYKDRIIKATFMTPPRGQKEAFAIRIERLPPDITIVEVDELCAGNNSLITLSRPTFTDDPVDAISAALDEERGLEGLDLLPGNNQRGSSTAFATFKSEGMARSIMEKVGARQHAFLGNQPLNIKPTYYSRNRLLREQMEALSNEISRLVEASEKKCVVQIDDHPDKNFIWLRMYVPFDYGPSTHTELEKLLSGMVLQDQDGTDLWDDYFDLPSSAKALKQLGTNAYIHCDHPSQKIKVFGGGAEREEAQKSVLKLVAKVRSQKHEIDVPRASLHLLVNGTLAELKAKIGLNKVSLDVITSKVIVRGSSSDVSKARSIVDTLNVQPALAGRSVCQICLQQPVDTITLSCRHNYCSHCLHSMIQQVGHGPVQCIAQCKTSDNQEGQCSATVPFVVIRNVLSMEEEKQFLASSFYRHVQTNPEQIFFCPSLNCQTAYSRSGERCVNLKCKFCLSDVCTFCRTFAHLGYSCTGRS